MVYKYMQSVRDGSLTNADNWLLTAPSGSGKTEFYRTIRDLFAECKIPIPVIQIDLSQITETGYKGDDVATIPRKILAQAPDMGGVCICFLDEADKKCRPSFGNNNVDNNAAAQANLLTLVEGIRTKLEIDKETRDFDSSKTMFVFMGAFQDVRNEKQERVAKSNMGFLSDGEAEKTVNAASDVFHDKLTMQDLIDYGMLEELAGRIMQVVNFKKLSKTDMRKLLTCKAEEISAQTGISIQLTGKALDELVKISYGSLGVRRPMNLIKEMALNTVATVFFDEGFDVDKDKVVIASEERAYVKRTRQADKVMSAG
jgi:ATP-dependent protease Clp ATPase subunit